MMRVTQPVLVIAIVMIFITAGPTFATAVTVNPGAIGAYDKSLKPFETTSIGLNYASTLTTSAGGQFSEAGGGTFDKFYNDGTVVKRTGLNERYMLSAVFTGSGTSVLRPEGFYDGTFNSFNLKIYANHALVGQSTGLVSGKAQLFPDSLIHASGQFDVTLTFAPVGQFFSGNMATARLQGLNDSYTIGAGSTFYSLHTGSGSLSFGTGLSQSLTTLSNATSGEQSATITNPEPGSLVLLGSGLAGFATLQLRRRWMRRETQQ